MKKIAVIGAGTMGNGIAHVFAQFGYSVTLIDVSQAALDKALLTITKNLDRQVAKEAISASEKTSILSNISLNTQMEHGLQGVDLVVEAATENIELKLKIFAELDRLCAPEVILASNTSSISITKIASVTNRPDKVIGMHFMNPVPVMKLVEVIRGYSTSNEVVGTGYTAGGNTLVISQVPTSTGTTAFLDFSDTTWTTATITARGALIYLADGVTNPAVAVLDFGSDKTSTAGNFTIQFPVADATNAILRIA